MYRNRLAHGALALFVVLGAPAEWLHAQSVPSLAVRATFVDTLGQNLEAVTGRASGLQFVFTNSRTGETISRTDFDCCSSNGIVSVNFAQGAELGDIIRLSARVSGSLTSTVSVPESTTVTSGDLTGGANRRIVMGGRPATRSLQFRAKFLDPLGNGLESVTGRANGLRFVVRNRRTGEAITRTDFDCCSGVSDVSVTLSHGGDNQAVLAGDSIDVEVNVLGSTASLLSHPATFIVTDGDIRRNGPSQGATPRHVIRVGSPPLTRSLALLTRYLDPLGNNLESITGRANGLLFSFSNPRTGEVITRTDFDCCSAAGDVSVNFTRGGDNQAVLAGDRLGVSVRVSGSTTSLLASPATLIVTAGDVARNGPSAGATPRHIVTLGGPALTRRLDFDSVWLDAKGQLLESVTGRANGLEFKYLNTRTREELRRTDFDCCSAQSNVRVAFTNGGDNQAVAAGDVIRVSARVMGSTTAVLSYPPSFVVTTGDISRDAPSLGRTPKHVVRIGGPPMTRALQFNTRWLDPLGQNLEAVTGRANGLDFTFRNTRTGETIRRTDFDCCSTLGDVSVGFTHGGDNQAALTGDVITVSVRVLGSTTATLSTPSSFVLSSADIDRNGPSNGATPRHIVRLGGPPLTRSMSIDLRFVDALGRNFESLVGRDGQVEFKLTNLRTGETFTRTGFDCCSGIGDLTVAFTRGGDNQAGLAGDVFRLEAKVSPAANGPKGTVPSLPASIVVTAGDLNRVGPSNGHTPRLQVRLTSLPFVRSFTVNGTVKTGALVPIVSQTVTLTNDATGETRTAVTNGSGVYSMAFAGTASLAGATQSDTFTFSTGGRFLARSGDIQAGLRTVDITGAVLTSGPIFTLQGTVTDALGAPVPGARVIGTLPVSSTDSVYTDAAGNYLVAIELSPGSVVTAGLSVPVAVEAPGQPVLVRALTLTATDVTNGIRLENIALPGVPAPRIVVKGTVADPLARPVDDVIVTARAVGRTLLGSARTPSTSRAGEFSIPLFANQSSVLTTGDTLEIEAVDPATNLSVRATIPVTVGLLGAGGVTRLLMLPDVRRVRLELAGEVVDRIGRPVDGADVSAVNLRTQATISSRTPSARTTGQFSLVSSAPFTQDFQPGDGVRVEVRAAGHALVTSTFAIPAGAFAADGTGAIRGLRIALSDVRRVRFELSGSVTDLLDRPLDGALVTALNLRTGVSLSTRTPSRSSPGEFFLFSQGTVSQDIQPADTLRLTAQLPGRSTVVKDVIALLSSFGADGVGAIRGISLLFEDRPATGFLEVSGILRDSLGRPRNGVPLSLTNAGTGLVAAGFTPVTTEDGSYRLVFGRTPLPAARQDDALFVGPVVSFDVTRSAQPASIILTAGDIRIGRRRQDLMADLPPRATGFVLKGRVLAAGNAPVDLASVRVTNARNGVAATSLTPSGTERGAFALVLLEFARGAVAPGEPLVAIVTTLGGSASPPFSIVLNTDEVLRGEASRDLFIGGSAGDIPVVDAVVPASGRFDRPTPIVLTGRRFAQAQGARLDDAASTPLAGFRALSDGTIEASVPAGLAPGLYPVRVFGAGGISAELAVTFTVFDPFAGPPKPAIALQGAEGGPAQVVRLDGSASTGDSLAYAWSLGAAPAGAQAFAEGAPIVTYSATLPGRYEFALAIRDARNRSASTTAALTIGATPPVVRIAAPPSVILRDALGRLDASETSDSVPLDGSGSFDPVSSKPLAFQWTLVSAPPTSSVTTSFDSLTTKTARLTVPFSSARLAGRLRDAGRYVFRLAATGAGGAGSADAIVTAIDPDNFAPTADPGIGQSVLLQLLPGAPPRLAATIPDPLQPPPGNRRAFIRLDGRKSRDPRGAPLDYAWRVVSSPEPVVLSSASVAAPTFAAAVAGDYVFALVVTSGRFPSPEAQVTVHADLASANSVPSAEAVARDLGTGVSGTKRAPLRVRAGRDTVVLDGTLSSDREDRLLTYEWRQAGGRPVGLSPSGTSARPRFIPPQPDSYVFSLVVRDRAGASSPPFLLPVEALSPLGTPPVLAVAATAADLADSGEDFNPEDDLSRPKTLRVPLPKDVILSAKVTDPDAGVAPLFQSISVSWRQVAGPAALLRPAAAPAGAVSAVRFEARTSGVHVFEALAAELDGGGAPTGAVARRRIRVTADAGGSRVPVAVFDLLAGGRLKATFTAHAQPAAPPVVAARNVVRLDASRSVDRNDPPLGLAYRWFQTGGPAVILSDPTSPVTTFVTPDLQDTSSHLFAFQLFVESGDQRSEPAPGALVAAAPTAAILDAGITVISVPVDPSTTSHRYDASDLARDTSAALVVRTIAGGRFQVYDPSLATTPFPIEGHRAYVIIKRRGAVEAPVEFTGADWDAKFRSVSLAAGLNLLGYPGPVPLTATAAALAGAANANFIAAFGTAGRKVPYVRDRTPDFALTSGTGYLLSVPADITVTLPARP